MSPFLISIVIPAHNRPQLLLEAINSVTAQNYSNYEVVVIDDGSTPPISHSALKDALGDRLTLHRHDSAQGVPKAKNAGINAAQGEVILLLDDDDLLMPNSLEQIFHAFSKHPQIDCLFLGVRPFGAYHEGPEKSRKEAMKKILERTNPEKCDGLYFFSSTLFDALLDTVPIDFQRPAARRSMWNITGGFDENALFSESAWAIHAACIGTIALTEEAITQWRIHGNNFGWPSGLELEEIRLRQIENSISSSAQLMGKFVKKNQQWHERNRKIKKHHSEQLFSKAYYLYGKNRKEGMKALAATSSLSFSKAHAKLWIKYFLSPLIARK